jgi:hypothetical protein
MPASTPQPKRVWGRPAVFHPDPTSLGKTPALPHGKVIFIRSPSETWSTDILESYVATLHARIANGANPALVAPHINSANAILRKRRAQKYRDMAK